MVSQNQLRLTQKKNHFIVPRSTTAVLSMAYLERAIMGMRKGARCIFFFRGEGVCPDGLLFPVLFPI